MAERPILFSGPMVRAILEGRKTQTRRVVKPQPSHFTPGPNVHHPRHPAAYFDAYCNAPKTDANPRGMSGRWCWWTPDNRQGPDWIRCPYGVPGDRLWVRETWYCDDAFAGRDECVGCVRCSHTTADRIAAWREALFYRADGEAHEQFEQLDHGSGHIWRPSIHMPRWASRLALEVTCVRVERLHDISEADAQTEGVLCENLDRRGDVCRIVTPSQHWRYHFQDLWASINSLDSWRANPWVWVVEFRRAEGATS